MTPPFPAAVAALLLVAALAHAQDTDAADDREAQLRAIAADPIGQIGLRARSARERLPVCRHVVIVRSPDAYRDAIAWNDFRYPVLWDDGTPECARRIGQFVRAFKPEGVSIFTPDPEADAPGPLSSAYTDAHPPTGQSLVGVAVASERDPAWPAAAALSMACGIPVLWLDTLPDGRPGSVMTRDEAQALENAIQSALNTQGRAWRESGDIDTIALCLNTPMRIEHTDGHLATTDVLGRRADGVRYAFTAQIPGTEAEATWLAMCSLFLHDTSAWLFDSYGPGFAPPYDMVAASEALSAAGWDVTLDGPGAGPTAWRGRIAQNIDAGMIHVNTKGHAHWFDVEGGRLYASDLPLLQRPAIVHFIHSFSAQRLNDRTSLARRWMEVGAYAYVGSVHEPTLGAFVPGEAFVSRMASGVYPLAAAARHDRDFPWASPPWKIQVIGDPMLTPGPPTTVVDEIPPGATPLTDIMQEHIRERRLDDALACLVMLDRRNDALALVESVASDAPDALSQSFVQLALPVAFEAQRRPLFNRLFLRLSAPASDDPLLVDLLWQINRAGLGGLDEESTALLRAHVREASVVEDAEALTSDLRRHYGAGVVRGFYEELIASTDDKRLERKLRDAMGR